MVRPLSPTGRSPRHCDALPNLRLRNTIFMLLRDKHPDL